MTAPRSAMVAALAVVSSALMLAGCTQDSETLPSTTTVERPIIDPADAVYRVVATSCTDGVEAVATGVAVAEDLLVTVAHTLDGAGNITVTSGGVRQTIDVVVLDRQRDIAVLELTNPGSAGQFRTWLGFGVVEAGESATIMSAATEAVTTKPAVVVQQLDLTLDGVGQRAGIELEAEVEPGDSGSPVIGEDGAIAGLVFATDRAEPRVWAVSASEIEAALTRKGDPITLGC